MALKPLSGIPSAEKLHTKALPKTAHAAFHRGLAAALASHLEKTVDLLERLDRIVDMCGSKLKRMRRDAMSGPREEVIDLVADATESPVRDTPLVSSAHKAKHYATSTYRTLASFASHLDHPQAVELLKKTLEENKASDKNLTGSARQKDKLEHETAPRETAASDESGTAGQAGKTHAL